MPRSRADFIAQGTWQSAGLHIWGWNGSEVASAAWIYGGFGRNRWSGADNSWHDSPISYGLLDRLELIDASGLRVRAPAVRLDALGAAIWLSDTPRGRELSPSIDFFARLTQLAVACVRSGRILPALTPAVAGDTTLSAARWVPVMDADLAETLEQLSRAAPPIALGGQGDENASTTPEQIFTALVDGITRSQLRLAGWRPDLGRQRQPRLRALRILTRALTREDPHLESAPPEVEDQLHALARHLDQHQDRGAGRRLIRTRVRLHPPPDPLEPWIVALELVDADDPGRWCTAQEVWAEAPTARDLAAGPTDPTGTDLGDLHQALRAAVAAVMADLPGCAALAVDPHPALVELDTDTASEFLERAPHVLERAGVELLGPQHLVRARVTVRAEARTAPADDRPGRFGKDALLEWSARVEGAELSQAELARISAAGSTLMHTGHRWVRIDPEGLRRARDLMSRAADRVDAIGLMHLLGDAEIELVAAESTQHSDLSEGGRSTPGDGAAGLTALIEGLSDERLTEAHEGDEFVGELRHYQRRGLGWLQFLHRLGLGGCLADDMGLGKTATTLAHLVQLPGPHLVVCPLSVVHNWEAEARRFTPNLRVQVHHGADRDAETITGDLVVTTYGLLARDADLAAHTWATVVFDEAQTIKNAATHAARAARRLRAGQKIALTGTPVENRLSELWSILEVTTPGLLGSAARFRERYGIPIERHNDQEAATRLRQLTSPFLLRRTKADRRLLPDLPDKIEQTAFASLTREQSLLYQQVVDQLLADAEQLTGMQRRGRVLAALTRLKQICNHPAHALADGSPLAGRSGKLTRFDELVDDLFDLEERALVFTQFREMGTLLQQHLRSRLDLDVPFLHGGVARTARQRMVEDFQSRTAPPLLIVSLKAGGTGLNLTAASQVIHYDRWWNPAVEDQATDRAWRIGQDRTVNVHKLVCQGTVEERIGTVIDDKRALADAVIGEGEAWLSELSTAELRDLVVLEATAPTLDQRHRRSRAGSQARRSDVAEGAD